MQLIPEVNITWSLALGYIYLALLVGVIIYVIQRFIETVITEKSVDAASALKDMVKIVISVLILYILFVGVFKADVSGAINQLLQFPGG